MNKSHVTLLITVFFGLAFCFVCAFCEEIITFYGLDSTVFAISVTILLVVLVQILTDQPDQQKENRGSEIEEMNDYYTQLLEPHRWVGIESYDEGRKIVAKNFSKVFPEVSNPWLL